MRLDTFEDVLKDMENNPDDAKKHRDALIYIMHCLHDEMRQDSAHCCVCLLDFDLPSEKHNYYEGKIAAYKIIFDRFLKRSDENKLKKWLEDMKKETQINE